LDADRAPQLKAIYKAGQEEKGHTTLNSAVRFFQGVTVVCFLRCASVIARLLKLLFAFPCGPAFSF
jgi:hypothetical protein